MTLIIVQWHKSPLRRLNNHYMNDEPVGTTINSDETGGVRIMIHVPYVSTRDIRLLKSVLMTSVLLAITMIMVLLDRTG